MQEILPLWLRVIRGTLRTNKSMYQNSKKTQDSSKIHAATAYQSLWFRVLGFKELLGLGFRILVSRDSSLVRTLTLRDFRFEVRDCDVVTSFRKKGSFCGLRNPKP